MNLQTLEEASKIGFNIVALKNMGLILRGKEVDEKDPFYGTIGSFDQMPDDLKVEVAEVCERYKEKLEKQLDAM